MAKNRKPNAAKQAAARRSQKHKPSSTWASWLGKNAPAIVIGIVAIAAVLLFGTKEDGTSGENAPILDGHHVPSIDGMPVEMDDEGENRTRDFLNEFVCKYQPEATKTDDVAKVVEVPGYCHPRLSAVPEYRTQRVSVKESISGGWKFWQTEPEDPGIPAGELVLTLPRPLQVWDLDALRDGFIRREFLGMDDEGSDSKKAVKHGKTQNPLDSGAFLAVYLLRLLHGSKNGAGSEDQCGDEGKECKALQQWGDLGQHQQRIAQLSDYLDILPTDDDRTEKTSESKINPHSHPLFWSSTLLKKLFPTYTLTYDLIRHYQQMIESEYTALKQKSDGFGKNVNYMQYLSMRINVLSRAFGLPASEGDVGALWGAFDDIKEQTLSDELTGYETSNFGTFLDGERKSDAAAAKLKLRSMCPLLDMYNSHPNPNVGWKYDPKTSSYIIRATKSRDISPGHSIVVSYGKYTDGHLFSKYGYVNGDGSSPTEISLAVFHRLLGDVGLGRQFSPLPYQVWDPDSRDEILNIKFGMTGVDTKTQIGLATAKQALKAQTKELLRYLIFDDGYDECLDLTADTDSSDAELKLLKLKHLIRLANTRAAWVVRIPPKHPGTLPLQSEGKYAVSNEEKKEAVAVNANRIISICRMLSLRPDDIDGEAVDYLEEGLESDGPFYVEKHDDALEYRAMMCVVRLCNAALGRYLGYNKAEPEVPGSREWNAWYIITGEVRAYGILQQTAASEANKYKQRYLFSEGSEASDLAMKVRDEGSCPLNQTSPLVDRL